jgi:murein DD-endopeptidase MepM/ murein hydrolase activator NlpD
LPEVTIVGQRSMKGQSPIDDPYIHSDYGMRGKKMHNGVDIVGKTPGAGQAVYSVTSGRIVRLVTMPDGDGGGVRVRIQASDGYQYNYMHLQVNSNAHLQGASRINRGDIVGRLGSTGRSSGPHLHFEIWSPSGAKINPYTKYTNLSSFPHR